jgi:xanthine dehydrogenase YagS FAD-binding subunit
MSVTYNHIGSLKELAAQLAQPSTVIAGGTELAPLMRAGIIRPQRILDINSLDMRQIVVADGEMLSLGALVTMADAAAHPAVRALSPAVAQALWESASPQVRNMATLAGNLMQRTRCCFFRDPVFPCNKRAPGSGCPANERGNRYHAIFGGSPECRAVHASDLVTALSALNASVVIGSSDGSTREVDIDAFYPAPAGAPGLETVVQSCELVTEIRVPLHGSSPRSAFTKLRDRASFEFAVVSVAVAASVRSNVVRDIRIAVGGVAYKPWRLKRVEHRLCGALADFGSVERALVDFAADAEPLSDNGYKVDLARKLTLRTVCDVVGAQ